MGALEETQLTYIKGLLVDLDQDKIKEVEDKFQVFLSFIQQDEEREAIGTLILARWGIEQQNKN
jgi:hypothetical protein